MTYSALSELQAVADRYALNRIAHDEARARGDIGATTRHFQHLIEAEAEFMPLAAAFATLHGEGYFDLAEDMPVVWRCGAVGMQGVVRSLTPCAGDVLATVVTERGVYQEFGRYLMPLSVVGKEAPRMDG